MNYPLLITLLLLLSLFSAALIIDTILYDSEK